MKKNKWLRFDFDKETLFAFVCGSAMILLSAVMNLFDSEIVNVILRDALMIVLLGFFTPLYYIVIVKKENLSVLGLHKKGLLLVLQLTWFWARHFWRCSCGKARKPSSLRKILFMR